MASYDIIFAGGGAAACVTAGRLAVADPSLRILILEAGPHIKDVLVHTQPARYFSNLFSLSDTLTYHVANPSPVLNGRSVVVPTGRCVGGGSGVNFCMYTRASASDYDDWEAFGNPGWGSADIIPLSNKLENYFPDGKNTAHGQDGPIHISKGGHFTTAGRDYLDAAAAYDKDRTFTRDSNDFKSIDMYSPWYKYIDPVTGTRSDTAHAFLYRPDPQNITIMDRTHVVRVIFEDKRAIGVEYLDDKTGRRHTDSLHSPTVVLARMLVVISAGAFGSPLILERSGIGAKSVLNKFDIEQVVDLPGVGENYNDHIIAFNPYCTADDADTMDDIFWGDASTTEVYEQEWLKSGQGLMAHNGIDAGIKMRPHAQDLQVLGPTLEKRWKEFYANSPDKFLMFSGVFTAYVGAFSKEANVPKKKYYSIGYYPGYPDSRGSVHLKAASDPYASIDFTPGYLDNELDVAMLRWSYKHGRELARRMKNYRGEFALGHPAFPKGSTALIVAEASGPIPVDTPNIEYSKEDDDAIDEYHKATVGTAWHSLGTCSMKPREQKGVVDPRLNVYGVSNLKVTDMSIAPSNVGANTYNTALIIGQKAAVIIAEDLGIKGV